MTQLFHSVHWEKKLSLFDLKSWITLVELRQKHLNWKKKTFIVLVTQRVTGSLVLLLKLLISKIHQNYCYINYNLKLFKNHLIFNVILIFKSPLPKWFLFYIINIWWFCLSLYIWNLYLFKTYLEYFFYRVTITLQSH